MVAGELLTESPPRAAGRLAIGLLGPLELRRGDIPVPISRGKQRLLLALLALRIGELIAEPTLIDGLWSEDPPSTAREALHVYVAGLRRHLEPDRGRGDQPQTLRTEAGGYRLDLAPDCVDVATWQSLLGRAQSAGTAERVPLLERALALWRGPMLPGLAQIPAVAAAITRFTRQRCDAVAHLALGRIELEQATAAIPLLHTELRTVPADERLWALLIRALYLTGRQAAALDTFTEARRMLIDEFGIEPGPELAGMHAAVLRQDPSLSPGSHMILTREHHRASDGLIGRDAELAAVRALLAGGAGVVTITGPGGVGKTTLAGRLARSTGRHVWVDLSSVDDPGLVIPRIATAMGVDGDPASRLADVVAALHQREQLVVLDTVEHLLPAADGIARLAAVSGTRVLVTSRTPLACRGERVFRLGPLALARRDATGEEIAAAPAVRLFLERARAVLPSLTVTDQTAAAAGEICRLLDGLPLAIEIAAARVQLMSIAALTRRLSASVGQFVTSTGYPARARTVVASVRWSRGLLSEPARRMLDRLPVFAGSFDAASAESVCGTGLPDPLDALSELAASSMTTTERSGDDVRFRLPTIVAESLCQLNPDAAGPELVAAHGRFFLAWARRQGEALLGDDPGPAVTALERDLPNLRAALDWGQRHEPSDTAEALLAVRQFFWRRAGAAELAGRCAAVLTDGRLPHRLSLWMHAALAHSWYEIGHFERAAEVLTAARSLLPGGDEAAVRGALAMTGAAVHRALGQPERATEVLADVLEQQRELPPELRLSLWNLLAWHTELSGDQPAAEDAYRKALIAAAGQGITMHDPELRAGLARVVCRQGRVAAATEQAERALAQAEKLGIDDGVVECLDALGLCALATGDAPGAADRFAAILRRGDDARDPADTARAIAGIASALASVGEYRRAAVLFGAAERDLRNAHDGSALTVEPAFLAGWDRCRERLGQDEFDRAGADGRGLGSDLACTEALVNAGRCANPFG